MAVSAFPGGFEDPGRTPGALRVGYRVWHIRDGRFGRVIAIAQGGLLCRVRPETGGSDVVCLGCELMALEPTPVG
jgi:hypothetical protein